MYEQKSELSICTVLCSVLCECVLLSASTINSCMFVMLRQALSDVPNATWLWCSSWVMQLVLLLTEICKRFMIHESFLSTWFKNPGECIKPQELIFFLCCVSCHFLLCWFTGSYRLFLLTPTGVDETSWKSVAMIIYLFIYLLTDNKRSKHNKVVHVFDWSKKIK